MKKKYGFGPREALNGGEDMKTSDLFVEVYFWEVNSVSIFFSIRIT